MQITIWPTLSDPHGYEKTTTWEQLATWMARPVEFSGQFTTKGWSAATFITEQRCLERATVAYALCLDFDGTATKGELESLLVGSKYMVHSSKSNDENDPHYRATVALSRPVTPAEYELLWVGFTRRMAEKVDQATKDVSRFWYVPCRTETTKWEFWACEGEPVDVDSVVALEREQRAKEQREAEAKARAERERIVRLAPEGNRVSVQERAIRYIEKMEPALSGSHGHDATFAVACVLVKGFSLSRDVALSILASDYNPRCQPPWKGKDLERKVDQASKARLPDGYLLGDSTGWTPARKAQLPPCPPDDDYTPEAPEWLVERDNDSESGPDDVAVEPEQQIESIEPSAQVESAPAAPEPPRVISAAERYGVKSIRDLALDVITDVNRPKDKAKCITGVAKLDADMGGMRAGMVTVLAARTSFGKTTFGLTATESTLKAGMNVLWFPFEDSTLLYGRRIVAARARLNALSLRDGDITYKERQRIMQVAQEAPTAPFMLSSIGKSIEWACQALRDIAKELKIHLVVMDYVQRMHTEKRTQDRRNEVTMAAELASDAIKEIGAAGLLISQIRRLKPGERPNMFDLKESGDLENCAEHIIMGWSEEENAVDKVGMPAKKVIHRRIFLEKNKDGPLTGEDIEVPFDNVSACFTPTEPQFNNPPPADWHDMNLDVDDALGAQRW